MRQAILRSRVGAREQGGSLFLSFKPPENNKIDNNPLFRLFFYFVRNLDRFWIDSFHDFSPFG